MDINYVTDIAGHKNAVLLPINDWERILEELEDLRALREKNEFFLGLKYAFEEVELIKQGKKTPKSFDDLLNEL